MLNQFIYTRCYPYRDLGNRGQVIRTEGYGVFSASRGLMESSPVSDLALVMNRTAVFNGAEENGEMGTFGSYDYYALTDGEYVLSFDCVRKSGSDAGEGSGRSGIHIKQSFIGKVDGYPFLWFGASQWDACRKSESSYYLSRAANEDPPVLPSVNDEPSGGYITPDRVRAFVGDGRAEAVRAGVWFLIREYSRPERERKVLLIRDTPENVELWISAISCAFSPGLAASITFSTNRTNLITAGNSAYFYYTDQNGSFSPMMNSRIAQERHPYAMIVGYHPKDRKSSSIRQMAGSEYGIIDGGSKTALFSTDESINSPYFRDLVIYGEDIMTFCREVLPSVPLKEISSAVPDLYEAYKYILDGNHKAEKWTYQEASDALKSLLQFGCLRNARLNRYILDEFIREYHRFGRRDQEYGFPVLKQMWGIGGLINRQKEVSGCAADMLGIGSRSLSECGRDFPEMWEAVKKADICMLLRPAAKEYFNDAELETFSRQFNNASSAAVRSVMEIYFDMLASEPGGLMTIETARPRLKFVCNGLLALIREPDELIPLLERLSRTPGLLGRAALIISKKLEAANPDLAGNWWDMVISSSGGNILELIRTLNRSRSASIEMVERLLANGINKSGKCDQEYLQAMTDSIGQLGRKEDTGLLFYRAWIRAEGSWNMEKIICSIRNAALTDRTQKELFFMADRDMAFHEPGTGFSAAIRVMKEWERDLGEISEATALYDLSRMINREHECRKLILQLYAFGEKKIPMPGNYMYTKDFSKLVEAAANNASGELNVAVLSMFDFRSGAEQRAFTEAFAASVLDRTSGIIRGNRRLYVMISLYEAIRLEYEVPGKSLVQTAALSRILEKTLLKILPDYYRPGMEEKVMEIGDRERKVKEALAAALADTGKKTGSREGIIRKVRKIFDFKD